MNKGLTEKSQRIPTMRSESMFSKGITDHQLTFSKTKQHLRVLVYQIS